MHTKLKIRIELFTDNVSVTDAVKQLGFFIKVTVLEKDDRFEINETTGDYLRFRGDDLYVKTVKNKKFGGLFDEGIILPHSDKLGYAYTKYFNCDNDRYKYLKLLHRTLDDWGMFWWGFEKDSPSKIIINDDTWEVVCATVENALPYDVY